MISLLVKKHKQTICFHVSAFVIQEHNSRNKENSQSQGSSGLTWGIVQYLTEYPRLWFWDYYTLTMQEKPFRTFKYMCQKESEE